MPAKLVSLIETETYRGQGIPSDPSRIVRQWFTPEGELVVESDTWQDAEHLRLKSREAGVAVHPDAIRQARIDADNGAPIFREAVPTSLQSSVSAIRWAAEFIETWRSACRRDQAIEPANLITEDWLGVWFANAIQAGIDWQRRAHEQKMAAVAHPAGSGGTGGQQMYVTPTGGAPTSTGSLVGTGTLHDLQGNYTHHNGSQFCQCADCLDKKSRIW